MKTNIKTLCTRICTALLSLGFVAVFTLQYVSVGLLGDCVSIAKSAGRTLERGYQDATKPVRDISNSVYKKTIRKPFNEIKGEFNKAIPKRLKYICRIVDYMFQ